MALTKIKTGSVSDSITLTTPTISGVLTANAGVVVDNFTLDGTTLSLSSGDMLVDVAGNITLDADDAGEIRLKDGGTQYGALKIDSSRFKIQSIISDKAMLLVGNDGGSEVTMLSLDAENAGDATFNAGVNIGGTVHASQTYTAPTNGISADTVGIFSKNNTANGNANVSVLSRSSGEARLYLGDETDENKWAIISKPYGGGLSFESADSERLRITNAGAIFATGVRSSSAANNDLRYNTANGEIYYQTSSERYKSNIVDLEFDTSNLYNLRPVSLFILSVNSDKIVSIAISE